MKRARVRFAPSPTGHLHIGGARTALFNWLFARHEGGSFILRIEDTDLERSSPELESGLIEDLHFLGFDWDEGPLAGGPKGPYRQSERLDIYRDLAGKLLAGGRAYPCFCTEEELDRKRRMMREGGEPPRYDGTCRNLTGKQREEKRGEGCPESIRFIVPDGSARKLEDIARGTVEFPAGMVGDFVILRSNGMPTYNFAAVVDDSMMEITHVIRGEEHLSNTLRQILIYEALDMPRPQFAHIPLILGSDRAKLSKRHGAPNIRDYRLRGYPPAGLINYLAFLGWSTRKTSEILSKEDLIEEFELGRVSDSPSIFDEVKLNWVSAQHIRSGGSRRYLDAALPFFPPVLREGYSKEMLGRIFDIVSENLPCFSALEKETDPFRPGPPQYGDESLKVIGGSEALLEELKAQFSGIAQWNSESIRTVISEAGKKLGIKGKNLYMPLRTAVTGSAHGPDLTSVLEIRGRGDVIGSIGSALEIVVSGGNDAKE